MRRFLALIAIPLLACVVLAGCGSSKPAASSSSSSSSSPAAGTNTSVTATGSFGQAPQVTIPKTQPANTLTSSPTVIGGTMLPGLESALIGKKVGSRILAVIPPAQGYGTSGNAQLGITGSTTLVFVIDMLKSYSDTAGATGTQVSSGGGTLPSVSAKSGSAPTLTFPSSSPPGALVTRTL